MKPAFEVLRGYFDRKRQKTPGLSLRSLASKMKLSPAYVSKVLSGKKPIPLNKIKCFARYLEIDAFGVRKIQRLAMAEQNFDEDVIGNVTLDLAVKPQRSKLPSENLTNVSTQKYSVLEEWYYLPILDLVACADFSAEPKWIAKRLGLREVVAASAWRKLVDMECVESTVDGWRKVSERILFPNSRIDPLIQKFHIAMMKRAADELLQKREQSDFDRRTVLGATVSSNEKSVQKAKKYLEEAFCMAAEILNEGPADQVYFLGLQSFPLTKNDPVS